MTKTRLGAMTTEQIAKPSNEASETWKSASTDKRAGRNREAAVALGKSPGVVEEFINAMRKKGKGGG